MAKKKKKVLKPFLGDLTPRYLGKTEKQKFKVWLSKQSIRALSANGCYWRWNMVKDLARQNGLDVFKYASS